MVQGGGRGPRSGGSGSSLLISIPHPALLPFFLEKKPSHFIEV